MKYVAEDNPQDGCFRSVHVPITLAGAVIIPLTGQVRLGGWSLLETTGAAIAQVELWDGGVSGGETVAVIELDANKAESRTTAGRGILIESGLSLAVLTGSVRGSLWLARA